MIIFGWGKRTVKHHGDTLPMTCRNCNNKVFYKLVEIKTWFTLFFIPVIPYSSKKVLMCDVCKSGMDLSTNGFKEAK